MFVYPISIHLNSLCQALFNYPPPSQPPSLPPSPKHFAQTLIMYLKSSTEQDTSFPQTGESSHEDSLGTSSGNNFYTPRSVTPVTCQIMDTSDPPSESRVEVKIFSLPVQCLLFLFTCKQGDQSLIYRRGGGGKSGGFWKDGSVFEETGGRGYGGCKQIIKEDLMRVLFRAPPSPPNSKTGKWKKIHRLRREKFGELWNSSFEPSTFKRPSPIIPPNVT